MDLIFVDDAPPIYELNLPYVYNCSGVYNVSVTVAYGDGYTIANSQVYILNASDTLEVETEKSITSNTGDNITLYWNSSSKLPVQNSKLFFGNTSLDETQSTWNAETGVGSLSVPWGSFKCAGQQSSKLVVFNDLLLTNTFITIDIFKEIDGMILMSDKDFALKGSKLTIQFGCEKGSHVEMLLMLGNGYMIYRDACKHIVDNINYTTNQTYYAEGEYTISLTLANQLGLLEGNITIYIQLSIPEFTFHAERQNTTVDEPVMFSITLNDSLPLPTWFYWTISFGDGHEISMTIYNDTAWDNRMLNVSYAWKAEGKYVVTSTLWHESMNSSVNTYNVSVFDWDNFTVSIYPFILSPGEAIGVNICGVVGKSVESVVNYGDNSMSISYASWLLDNNAIICFTHVYEEEGTYMVNVYVDASFRNDSFIPPSLIHVAYVIAGLNLFVPNTSLPLPGAYLCFQFQHERARAFNVSNVTCVYQYGDGIVQSEEGMYLASNTSIERCHTYTTSGIFKLVVTCSNVHGSQNGSQVINITQFNMEIADKSVPFLNGRGNVSFSLADRCVHIPPTLQISWSMGDETGVTDAVILNRVYQYTQKGAYSVTVNVSYAPLDGSKVQEYVWTGTVQVGLVQLSSDRDIVRTGIDTVDVSVTGWRPPFTYTIDWGDATSSQCADTDDSSECSSGNWSTAHVYSKEGMYWILGTASHESVGTEEVTYSILVQNSVESVTFHVNSYNSIPEDTVIFTLALLNKTLYPTNASCLLTTDYGNDRQIRSFDLHLETTYPQHILHNFTQLKISDGKMIKVNASMYCWNIVSSISHYFIISLFEKIQGVTILPDTFNPQINYEVTFDVTIESGADFQFRINYGDGTDDTLDFTGEKSHRKAGEKLTAEVRHFYSVILDFSVTVTLWNAAQNKSITPDWVITPFIQTDPNVITLFNITTDPEQILNYATDTIVTFRITPMVPNPDTYLLLFGDGTSLSENLTSLSVSHTYRYAGQYNVSLIVVTNNVSRTSSVTFVLLNPCLPPRVECQHKSVISAKELTFLGLSLVGIYCSVDTRCDGKVHTYTWTIYDSKTNATVAEKTSTGPKLINYKDDLKLLASMYKVRLESAVAGMQGYNSSDITYMKLQNTALKANIHGGKNVVRGISETLEFDASRSEDPDSDQTLLTYAWSCRKLHSGEASIDVDDLALTTSVECMEPVKAVNLILTQANLNFPANVFVVDTKYIFEVEVSSLDGRTATYRQGIDIKAGTPPSMTISFQTLSGNKVNADKQTIVAGHCSNCLQLSYVPEYHWKLFKREEFGIARRKRSVPNAGLVEIDMNANNLTSTGTIYKSIAFYADVFELGKTYILRLEASVADQSPGLADLEFTTNYPPENGTCHVTPTQGDFTQDFIFSCFGWTDEGKAPERPGDRNTEDISYSFVVDGVPIHKASSTSEIADGSPPIKIKQGLQEYNYQHEVSVIISDKIGACSIFKLNVTVTPKTSVQSVGSGFGSGDEQTQEANAAMIDKQLESFFDPSKAAEPDVILARSIVFVDVLSAYKEDESGQALDMTSLLVGAGPSDVDPDAALTSALLNDPLDQPQSLITTKIKDMTVKLSQQIESTLSQALSGGGASSLDTNTFTLTAAAIGAVARQGSHLIPDEALSTSMNVMSLLEKNFEATIETTSLDNAINVASIFVGTSVELLGLSRVNDSGVDKNNNEELAEFQTSEEMEIKQEQQENSTFDPNELAYLNDIKSERAASIYQQDLPRAKRNTAVLLSSVENVARMVTGPMVAGQPPVSIQTAGVSVIASKLDTDARQNSSLKAGGVNINIATGTVGQSAAVVTLTMVVFTNNPMNYGNGSADVTSEVIKIGMKVENGSDVTMPMDLDFDAKEDVPSLWVQPVISPGDVHGIYYQRMSVASEENSVMLTVKVEIPPDLVEQQEQQELILLYEVYIRANVSPSPQDYDHKTLVKIKPAAPKAIVNVAPNERSAATKYFTGLQPFIAIDKRKHSAFKRQMTDLVSNVTLPLGDVNLRDQDYFLVNPMEVQNLLVKLGIDLQQQIYRGTSTSREKRSVGNVSSTFDIGGVEWELDELKQIYRLARSRYEMQAVSRGCRTWDEENSAWEDNSCQEKGDGDSITNIKCECPNPKGSSFASSFVVAPNVIDFNMVFANWDPSNVGVLLTCLVIMLAYIPLAIWLRRLDKKDIIQWGVTRLRDNFPQDNYYYLITVYTSMKLNAGTQSRIGFTLSGEYGNTGVRQLTDGMRMAPIVSYYCI